MDLSLQSVGGKRLPRPDGTGSAADRVYEDLRERILGFDLPPDSTLSRGDLAAEYGVSQTPVREALLRLEDDGLIRIYPQSRTVVARIDEQALKETHFLRVSIETEVVRRIAAQDHADTLRQARGLVRLQQTLMDDPSQFRLFYDFDVAFHRTLFDAVGMRSLHVMLGRKLGHMTRCRRLEMPREGKLSEIVHGHLAVIEGIASGNPELAAAAMRGHIGATIRRVTLLRAEFPDYFEPARE